MYLSWFLIIAFGLYIFYLHTKVKSLEKKSGDHNMAKLVIRGKDEFFKLPIIHIMAKVDKKHIETPWDKLPAKEKEKVRKVLRILHGKMWFNFRFFYDKQLVFVKQKDNTGFIDMPEKNDTLIYELLTDQVDEEEVYFVIKYRMLTDDKDDTNISVFTGYIKRQMPDRKNEIIKLFDFPEYLINPVYIDSWKNNPELAKKMMEKCGLIHKEDVDFSEFEGDLGEKEYFLGRGNWIENKYFEFIT